LQAYQRFQDADIIYDGCSVFWIGDISSEINIVASESNRICAIKLTVDNASLLCINVYLPCEINDDTQSEFLNQLSNIHHIMNCHSNCQVILGGDFNVDFSRQWRHTSIHNNFCDQVTIFAAIKHASVTQRFHILDHFILSGRLFDTVVAKLETIHDV
jgi:hypothetical protein